MCLRDGMHPKQHQITVAEMVTIAVNPGTFGSVETAADSEEQVNCATHDKGSKCQVWTMKNGRMNVEEQTRTFENSSIQQ